MTDATLSGLDFIDLDRGRLVRRMSIRMVAGAALLAFGVAAAVFLMDGGPDVNAGVARPVVGVASAVLVEAARTVDPSYGALFEPSSIRGPGPIVLAQVAPLASTFVFVPAPVPDRQAGAPEIELPPPAQTAAVEQMIESVPLPEPRPPQFWLAPGQPPGRAPGRVVMSRPRVAAAAPAPTDTRNFIEKLFNLAPPPGPALGYAAPEEGLFGNARRLTAAPREGYDRWTAIYDIAAHTVYMPSGARLEAHSGLGDKLDDPSQVHVQNRGATPPHLYDLTPREQPFHGVQALRLNPVGGGGIFGRSGLLAHTYMLGPNGDSNGCVSFRDYNAFLQAYANGEVRRLAVVARLN